MRGKHEGTAPRLRRDGKTWESQVTLAGQRVTRYGKSPAEVRRKIREVVRRHEDGLPLADSKVTVGAYAEGTWRTVKLPASKVKASTRGAYLGAVRRMVLPTLADKKVAEVKESDCEAVLLAMEAAGLSPSYQRLVHTAMGSLFGTAKRELRLTTDPMAQVARPAPGRSKARHLTPEQFGQLAAVLTRTPTLTHLIPFMALTGLRRGEALGVRWEDVDEEEGVIHLRTQVTRDEENGLHLGSLKTEGSERDVELTPLMRELLRTRRKVQIMERMAAPAGTWGDDQGLVFTTKLGGLIEPNNVNRAFRGACKRAGLPTTGAEKVTPHSLRHSVATLLLANGTDEKVVAAILGHSSPRITREVYQHVVRTQTAAALGQVGEALGWS